MFQPKAIRFQFLDQMRTHPLIISLVYICAWKTAEMMLKIAHWDMDTLPSTLGMHGNTDISQAEPVSINMEKIHQFLLTNKTIEELQLSLQQ